MLSSLMLEHQKVLHMFRLHLSSYFITTLQSLLLSFFLWDISFFWDIINSIVMGKPTTRPNKKNIRKGPK